MRYLKIIASALGLRIDKTSNGYTIFRGYNPQVEFDNLEDVAYYFKASIITSNEKRSA